MKFDPAQTWHTGKYSVRTDRFDPPGVACFFPQRSNPERILYAADLDELRQAYEKQARSESVP